MANPDKPSGFKPVGNFLGGRWEGNLQRCIAADNSADSTNNHGDLYIGDCFTLDAAGNAVPADSGDSVDIAGVVVAVGRADDDDTGNEAGPFDPNDLGRRYANAADSADLDLFVYYVPAEGNVFEIQSASDLDLDIGDECDHTMTAATTHGSRTTGKSNIELAADSNSNCVVVSIPRYVDNDDTLANTRYNVRFRRPKHLAAQPTS